MRHAAWFLLWAVAGCVDPGAKLDAFHRRELASRSQDAGENAAADGAAGAPGRLPSPAQIEGQYLFVVSTVLSPKKPILSLLEVKAVTKGERLELMQRDRPLSLEDRKTPVGPFGPWRSSLVQADGGYRTDSINIVTPGAADAVQPGVESESNLEFYGTVPLTQSPLGEPEEPILFWCGKADGMLLRPIQQSLDGSTFAVMRITDPDAYPSPVLNCAMDPAEPL